VPASSPATPLSQKKHELERVKAKLGVVYQQVDMAVEKYNLANTRLDDVNAAIKENERLLKVARYNLALANAQLKTRAVLLYKARGVEVLDMLFSTSSFDELVSQLSLMARLGDSDVDTVKSIDAYRRDIRGRRLKLDADREEAAKLLAERRAQKDEVLALEAKLESLERGLEGDISRLREQARQAAAAAAAAAQQEASAADYPQPPDPGGSGHSGVVGIALRYLGVPYVFGAADPNVGFDCSGLTMYCYAQLGYGLPHSATAQAAVTTDVPLNALQPGDLVFFGGPSYSSHVAIYMGGGQIVHASSSAGQVTTGALYSGAWVGGRP
jgi:cell wall-associated NlpC family hydrolase